MTSAPGDEAEPLPAELMRRLARFRLKSAPIRTEPAVDEASVNCWLWGKSDSPQKQWRAWRIPYPDLPIDRAIRTLLDQGSLRTRQELEQHRIKCPYRSARLALADATRDANTYAKVVEAQRMQWALASLLAEDAEAIGERISVLTDLASQIPFGVGWVLFPSDSTNLVEDIQQENHRFVEMVERTYCEFGDLAVRAKTAAERARPQNSGDPWRVAFVRGMGEVWNRLTGQRPTPGSAGFVNFLVESVNTLDEINALRDRELLEGRWERSVRTAQRVFGLTQSDRWERTINEVLIAHRPTAKDFSEKSS